METYRPGNLIEGRWEVREVRHGGLGVVYLCLDHEIMGMPVALKTFQGEVLRSRKLRDAFKAEADKWAQLGSHRHLVSVWYIRELGGRLHIGFEWVTGRSGLGADLSTWIGRPELDLPTCLDLAIQICEGMKYAVERMPTLVHCDLKPANILITDEAVAKVSDFGLARAAGVETGVIGTPPYMAPEQCRGLPLDTRSDIYAFGCVLYEMLSGRLVFDAASREEFLSAHQNRAPVPLAKRVPTIPEVLSELVMQCLEKAPERRPPTFACLLSMLLEIYKSVMDRPHEAKESSRIGTRDSPAQLLVKGPQLFTVGRYREALAVFDEAVVGTPDSHLAWGMRGMALKQLGNHADALASFDKALALNPDHAASLGGKADVLVLLGRPRDALACLDQSLAMPFGPAHPFAWLGKANIFKALGDTERSLECYRRAVEANEHLTDAWYNMANLYLQQREYQPAVDCYDRVIALKPDFAWAWLNKGICLRALNRVEEALACLDQMLQLDPGYARGWLSKGNVLTDLDRPDDALTCYDRAIALDPNLAQAWMAKIQTLIGLGRHDEAAECMKLRERH